MTPTPPLMEVKGLTRRIAGVTALDGVDAVFARGEIVAIMGESGAGRSTLLRLLAGMETPTSGQLLWNGREITLPDVRTAQALGIALAHQTPAMDSRLTAAEYMFLGREPRRWGVMLDRRQRQHRAQEILDSLGASLAASAMVASLDSAQRQLVEIARALSQEAKLLMLDEPAGPLRPGQTDRLFEILGDLQARGVSLIYASNRFGEVEALATRVLVLRDGAVAGCLPRAGLKREVVVQLMAGTGLDLPIKELVEPGRENLRVTGLRTARFPEHALDFQVCEGEIVGLTGLVGAGGTEVVRTLFGLEPWKDGSFRVDTTPVRGGDPAAAMAAGVILVPSDRTAEGLIEELSTRENLALVSWPRLAVAGCINPQAVNVLTTLLQEHVSLAQEVADTPVRHLNAGQQQKISMAKWLAHQPQVALFDEPGRGIDIASKAEVYELMERLAERGAAVLFHSSDWQEILRMADRVLVMNNGRLAGILTRDDDFTERGIMRLAADMPPDGPDAALLAPHRNDE